MNVALDARILSLSVFSSRGIGRYIHNLIQALLDIGDERTYTLLKSERLDIPKHDRLNMVDIGAVPVFSKKGIVDQHFLLPMKLSQYHFDIIHYPFFEVAPVWGNRRTKRVMTVPDLIPVRSKRFGNSSKQQTFERLLKKTLLSADALVAISSYVKSDIEDFLGTHCPPISVIPLAVDTQIFRQHDKQVAAAKVSEMIGIQTPYILYTGGFDSRKQVGEFIEVYHHLVHEAAIPHILVLSGRVEAYPSFVSIIRKIAQLKLQQRVIITDYVLDEQLVYLYNAADVVVFPSAAEGFGLPLLEAMACGTPVVAFKNTSIPEVLGDDGLLVPDGDWGAFADTLAGLLRDHTLREQVCVTGIRRAQGFSWERTAQLTSSVYKTLYTFGQKF